MKIIYSVVAHNGNRKDHSCHHFHTQSPTPTPDRHVSLEERVSVQNERVFSKVALSLQILASSSDFQEKLRFQGTRKALRTQDVQSLARFLCKETSKAAMLRYIRKTLRCNQALPGGGASMGSVNFATLLASILANLQ